MTVLYGDPLQVSIMNHLLPIIQNLAISQNAFKSIFVAWFWLTDITSAIKEFTKEKFFNGSIIFHSGDAAEPTKAVSCQNDFNIFNVSSVQHLLITNVIAPSNLQNPFATIRQQRHQTMRVQVDLC